MGTAAKATILKWDDETGNTISETPVSTWAVTKQEGLQDWSGITVSFPEDESGVGTEVNITDEALAAMGYVKAE